MWHLSSESQFQNKASEEEAAIASNRLLTVKFFDDQNSGSLQVSLTAD